MDEERIRQIIREEIAFFNKSDRFTFQKTLQISGGRNIELDAVTGTKFGTAVTQLLAFFGRTPMVQPTATGSTTFTAGGGSAVKNDSTFVGGVGSTAYTIGDIIRNLKDVGLLAQ